MKKAQLTLMMVMGIIILLGTAIFLYLFVSQTTKESQEQITIKQLRQITIKPIKEYITNCLDITAMQGLELVGKQGGRIYISQGGLTPNPGNSDEYIKYNEFNVSYSIQPPAGSVGDIYFSAPPEYPWQNFPHGETKSFFGYFGWSSFPSLYETSNNSIQTQLQTYIENNIFNCVDWTIFESKGLRFQTKPAKAKMIIAKNISQIAKEDYISFNLNWPITITDITFDAQTIIDEFTLNYPLDLSKFYYFTKSTIDSDVTDVSFDISSGSTDKYTIKTIKDAKDNDDIIIFQDLDSIKIGKPFEFWIARKNRIPALFQINSSDILKEEVCLNTKFVISNQGVFNTNPSNQGKFPVFLNALDPDEDNITYQMTFPDGFWNRNPIKIKITAEDDSKSVFDYQVIEVQGESCQ